jgi:hypothetical protein
MINISYDTVTEAVKGLQQRGFTVDFNLRDNCLVCHDRKFDVNNFEIVEVYRFEGNSDPADEAIVYAIESVDGIKGVLVNGYGISSDPMSAEMARKLSIHKS